MDPFVHPLSVRSAVQGRSLPVGTNFDVLIAPHGFRDRLPPDRDLAGGKRPLRLERCVRHEAQRRLGLPLAHCHRLLPTLLQLLHHSRVPGTGDAEVHLELFPNRQIYKIEVTTFTSGESFFY